MENPGRATTTNNRQLARRPSPPKESDNMPETRGRPIIKTFTCKCGWHRSWNEDTRGDRIINHPLWGEVKTREAAFMDIRNHNCTEALAASLRARERFGVPDYPDYVPWYLGSSPMDSDNPNAVDMPELSS